MQNLKILAKYKSSMPRNIHHDQVELSQECEDSLIFVYS